MLGKQLSGSSWGPDLQGDRRELYKREVAPLLVHNVEMARRVVRDYLRAGSQTSPAIHPTWIYKVAMSEARDVFRYPPVVAYNLGSGQDMLEVLKVLRSVLADLHPRFVEAVKDRDEGLYAQVIKAGITRGFWWSDSPQQYLDNLQNWLELSAGRDPTSWSSNLTMGCCFEFGSCPLWADREDNAQRYLAFLGQLAQHDNPLLRACAQQGSVRYYADCDPDKAADHYRVFIETVVKDIIPALPEWG